MRRLRVSAYVPANVDIAKINHDMKKISNLPFIAVLLAASFTAPQNPALAKPEVRKDYNKVLDQTRISVQEGIKKRSGGFFGGNTLVNTYYVVHYDYPGKEISYPPVLIWSFRRDTNQKNGYDVRSHKSQWSEVNRVTFVVDGKQQVFYPFYDNDFSSKMTLWGRKNQSSESISFAISPETLADFSKASKIGFALETGESIVASGELAGGDLDSLGTLSASLPTDKKVPIIAGNQQSKLILGRTVTMQDSDPIHNLSNRRAVVAYRPNLIFQVAFSYSGDTPAVPEKVRFGVIKSGSTSSLLNQKFFVRAGETTHTFDPSVYKVMDSTDGKAEAMGADIPLLQFLELCATQEVIVRAGDNTNDTIFLKGNWLTPLREIERQILAIQPKSP